MVPYRDVCPHESAGVGNESIGQGPYSSRSVWAYIPVGSYLFYYMSIDFYDFKVVLPVFSSQKMVKFF